MAEKDKSLKDFAEKHGKKAAELVKKLTAKPITIETEAGTQIIPRAEIVKILKETAEETGLNINKLLTRLGITAENAIGNEEGRTKIRDVLGHLALEKTGLPENATEEAMKKMYPEINAINPNMIETSVKSKDIGGSLGQASMPYLPWQQLTNPMESKIKIARKLDPYPVAKLSTGLHEAEHVAQRTKGNFINQLDWPGFVRTEQGLIIPKNSYETSRIVANLKDNPAVQEELIKNFERQTGQKFTREPNDSTLRHLVMGVPGGKEIFMGYGNAPITAAESLNRVMAGHHGPDVRNFELEKIKELYDKGIITPTTEDVAKRIETIIKPETEKYLAARREQVKRTAAAAAGAVGAGVVAGQDEAQAQEPGQFELPPEPVHTLPDLPPEATAEKPYQEKGPGGKVRTVLGGTSKIRTPVGAGLMPNEGEGNKVQYPLQSVFFPESSGPLSGALDLAGAPQRIALQAFAQKLGVKGNIYDANSNSVEIIDAIAKKLDVPPDSVPGLIGKTSASMALLFGTDPLNELMPGASSEKSLVERAKNINKTLGEGGHIGAKIKKSGSMTGQGMLREATLPEPEKIIQQFTTGEEFAKKQAQIAHRKTLEETINKHMANPISQANYEDKELMKKKAQDWVNEQMKLKFPEE